MGLNWNIQEVEDQDNLCWFKDEVTGEEKLRGTTETLIFLTMIVGINRITKESWEEFFVRVNVLERTQGPFLIRGDGVSAHFAPDLIRAHVGLTTNAGIMSRAEFKRQAMTTLWNNAEQELAKFAKEEAEKGKGVEGDGEGSSEESGNETEVEG